MRFQFLALYCIVLAVLVYSTSGVAGKPQPEPRVSLNVIAEPKPGVMTKDGMVPNGIFSSSDSEGNKKNYDLLEGDTPCVASVHKAIKEVPPAAGFQKACKPNSVRYHAMFVITASKEDLRVNRPFVQRFAVSVDCMEYAPADRSKKGKQEAFHYHSKAGMIEFTPVDTICKLDKSGKIDEPALKSNLSSQLEKAAQAKSVSEKRGNSHFAPALNDIVQGTKKKLPEDFKFGDGDGYLSLPKRGDDAI